MNTQKLKTELEARGLIAQTGGGELADILKQKRTMYVVLTPLLILCIWEISYRLF